MDTMTTAPDPVTHPGLNPNPPSALLPDFDLRDLERLHAAPSHAPHASPADGAPAGHLMGHVRDAVPPVSSPPQPPSTDAAASPRAPHKATPPADQALLDALHRQYLRRLHDPNHVDEQAPTLAWAAREAPSATRSHADPLLDLMARANALASTGAGYSLEHMVSGTPKSAELLACFDDHGRQDLLAPAMNDSVMHLLAPPEFTPPAADPRSPDWIGDLPVLTRREHHGMTLDSAMDTHAPAPPRIEPLF